MAEDRLQKDYDTVENLSDLIKAREERESDFADDVDAMKDIDLEHIPSDAERELSYPHKHGPSEDERLGLDVELLDTPDEKQVEFDWQDSAEEMLPTDPSPEEGMGESETIEGLAQVNPADLVGPIPSPEGSPETDTAATEEEAEELFGSDGGTEERPPPQPIPLEDAMETDSDELDFSIADKFQGEVDHETAHQEFEEMRILTEREAGEE